MTIGIFTAMQSEARSFVTADSVTERVGEFTFVKFELNGAQAVLCVPPSVGEICASAAVQLLISRFNVNVVLNFGVVGALTEQASHYNMVYVSHVTHYDMDTSSIDNCGVGYYCTFSTDSFAADEQLLASAKQVLDLPVVKCASADKFVSDSAVKADLADRFGADICDMESAGVLIACKLNNVPCLFVKCIADTLFGGAEEYSTKIQSILYDFRAVAQQIVRCC